MRTRETVESMKGVSEDRVAANNKGISLDPGIVYRTVKEVSKESGRTLNSVHYDCTAGKLPATKYKTAWYILPEDAEAYIQKHSKQELI